MAVQLGFAPMKSASPAGMRAEILKTPRIGRFQAAAKPLSSTSKSGRSRPVLRLRVATGTPPPHPAASRAEPALVQEAEERARSIQNRLADRITAFARSMSFVYIHLAWFGCWIGLRVEHYPSC